MEEGITYKQVYNAENRIASIARLASGDCTTPSNYASKWDFAYDGDGVRTNTLTTPYDENGLPQTASLTSYFFGGAYETRSDGTTLKYYSFAGQMVAMRDDAGLQYFLTDHLGSMVSITDDTGTLTSQQRYLPFGGERTDVPSPQSAGTDYGYTGQRSLDPGMGGLMDYKARFYSHALGRFIQPDSIVPNQMNPESLNRFSYTYNNPIKYTDPSGHDPWWCETSQCRVDYNNNMLALLPKPKPRRGGGNPGGNGDDDPKYGLPVTPPAAYVPKQLQGPACFNDNKNRVYIGQINLSPGNFLSTCSGEGSTSMNSGSGLYPSEDAIIGGSNAFVEYWASYYSVRYERMTKLTISEEYYFSGSMPIWSLSSGSTFLVVKFAGGPSQNIRLGDLETTSPPLPMVPHEYLSRETDVYFYGSVYQPENIWIKVYFSTETNGFSADYFFPDYSLP